MYTRNVGTAVGLVPPQFMLQKKLGEFAFDSVWFLITPFEAEFDGGPARMQYFVGVGWNYFVCFTNTVINISSQMEENTRVYSCF